MRFDLVDLQLFVAIAEASSITHGAARANLALASASARIKALEATLGVVLLTRGRRGILLTAAGEALLGHARIVLHDVETMRGEMGAYARGLKARVFVLANTVGLSEHLPKALASFLREHPNISLAVEERESADIAQAIASGVADLGFAAEHTLPDTLERFSFSEDRLMLVTSQRNAFAGRRQIDFKEVINEDFVGLTNSTALQSHIGKYAAKLGARLRFRAQLRDFDAMCQMVAAGVGVAIVPEVAARRCARSMPIRMVRIRDAWASRHLAICVRSFKGLSRPAQQLYEHLRAEAAPRRSG
ncbi:LysR substrate-binding domain-containing protein [Tardiphaga sp.]|uniref:LysR substrate-binding domain-containing protein n=1 Tax=Tardiphaga sp. TaxID=1926292 RepID=UPI0026260C00|nr:LysR substrate-binding domain-containing protein [Tardiphaga sp.]MDB5615937.1 LysR family transcriptional regulator [Tardiphaga sp.]